MPHEFIRHLVKDHSTQKSLAKQLQDAAPEKRQELRAKLWEELYPHIIGEEASIFAFLTTQAKGEVKEHALECLEEHKGAKHALAGLMACDVKAENFKAKVKVLDELNKHHIEEEESNPFKEITKLCDKACLDELFKKYEAAEEKAKKAGPQKAAKE